MSNAVLVTGGAGFIGSHLVEELAKKGVRVRMLDDFSTGTRRNLAGVGSRVEILRGDIRKLADVKKSMAGVAVAYHLAALGSVPRSVADPKTSHEVNATGTLNVLLAAREAKVDRVVLASSSSVYGDIRTLPKREDMVPLPRSPYAITKLMGELYGRIFSALYGLDTVALRFFNVYGPRQDPHSAYAAVIPRFFAAFLAGRSPTIHGDGRQTRDFTFVEDCVRGIVRAGMTERRLGGTVFNIAGGKRISVNDLADAVRRITGAVVRPIHGPIRPGDVKDSLASIVAARRILGYRPRVAVREGLRKTHAWYVNGSVG
ncbi:MAG: SDR family oxidoreductase [Nitrospirae bacterium]|nr:SDR family oxidoreductase [Nitrospirota bacterium]